MRYGSIGQATAWRIPRLLCALPLLGSFSERYGGVAQEAVTSTVTDTIIQEDVVFSTVTTTLASCPCPCSTLATGPGTQTTTVFSLPSGDGVVVQVVFSSTAGASPTAAPDIRTYFLNRNQGNVVVDNSALVLYLNSAGSLQDASDLSEQIYFTLPSSIVKRQKVQKRFNDLLPVFIGDVPSDAAFQGYEDVDGDLYFVTTTSQGTFTLGFTICPTDNTTEIGVQVYMFDTELETPDVNGCIVGLARTLPYSDYAAGSTSFPTGTETGNPTGTTGTGTTASTTGGTTGTASTGRPTNSEGSSTSEETTGGITRTSRSRTTGGPTTDDNTSSDTSETGTGTDTNTGTNTGTGGGGGSTSSISFTTITAYTTDVAAGSSSLVTNSPTVTAFYPYPSSLKVVDTLRNFDDSNVNTTNYLNQFFKLPPGLLGESPMAIEYYRVYELDRDGHLSAVIAGPAVVGDVWLGREDTEPFTPQFAFAVVATDGAYTGDILKFATLEDGGASNGRLLRWTIDEVTGLLSLDDVNVTLHAGLWLCGEDATVIGLTDGNDPNCNYDEITEPVLWGNQVAAEGPPLYEVGVSPGFTTEGLGQGPTYTVHNLGVKVLVTETISIDPATAVGQNIFYGAQTVNGGNSFPTASIYVTQVVRHLNYDNVWNISGTVRTVSTLAQTEGTATIATVQGVVRNPQFIMTYLNPSSLNVPWFVSSDDPPRLKTYGRNIVPTDDYPASFFWIDANLHLVARRQTDGTGSNWYPNPLYAYFQFSTFRIVFFDSTTVTDADFQLLVMRITELNADPNSNFGYNTFYIGSDTPPAIDLSAHNGYTCNTGGKILAQDPTPQEVYWMVPGDPANPFSNLGDFCNLEVSYSPGDSTHARNFHVVYDPDNVWRRDTNHMPTAVAQPHYRPADHGAPEVNIGVSPSA
ncbi:hypothetical protein TWF696_008860 [Orbilia brochopaga]|uniref:Uncharacterized protein n=1 Tax=Orbilia brochopaga TaxID=3140254 RepID=A0AAV9UGL2_9PEZI